MRARRTLLRAGLAAGAVALAGWAAPPARAAGTLRVAYAGSMGVVMDRHLGPAFARASGAAYQGRGAGAYGLARLLAAGTIRTDVFVSITPGPIALLEKAGRVAHAVPIASTAMVIAYSPKSRFAPAFAAAVRGGQPWYQVLLTPGLRFGRTDPLTDPQGQNIIFLMKRAEQYYHRPGLAHAILGPWRNPAQIFSEPSLLSRLEAGQMDASSAYESAAISHHLPFLTLPDAINLSDPAVVEQYAPGLAIALEGANGKTTLHRPAPLVFYAAVLKNAPDPALAARFLAFLRAPAGQAMLRKAGYGPPKGGGI